MQILSISIGDDKKPKYTSVPLVVGENKTTFVTVSRVPADWTGLTLYALVTTPKRVKVDEFEITDTYDGNTGFLILNSMLDGPGTLEIEYIAKSGAQEVSRTSKSVKQGVASARSEIGDIPLEPLPDLIADVTADAVPV